MRTRTPMVPSEPGHVLVLGIGNLLWADEGFGIRAAEALHAAFEIPDAVSVVDGGTQGLYLLPHVQRAQRLIVFDAIDYHLAPGTLRILRDGEIPSWLGVGKVSLHQSSFQEVLALAALTGHTPRESVLIGAQPADLRDYGGSLTEVMRACIAPAVAAAVEILEGWGMVGRARNAAASDPLNTSSLSITAYEQHRPAATAAFRGGDARFINVRLREAD